MSSETSPSWRSEVFWGGILLITGLVPRLTFITLFPTHPISDFRGLVDFAVFLRNSGFAFAKGTWFWEFFSPGLPSLLSVILRVFPYSPEATARWSTAILTGLIPLLPYGIWHRVLNFKVRVLAGLLLALWPGQIFFSGVVAQDNWVILPIVALAALSVRVLISGGGGHPVWAGALFALGVFIRQEMLIVLLPVALTSAGVGAQKKQLFKSVLIWSGVALLLLFLIAGQRAVATGRFKLTTEHGGKAVLGAYVPGAGLNYWIDPAPFLASIDPALLENKNKFQQESSRLILNEFLRRPSFHLIRMVSSVLNCLRTTDTSTFYWSLSSPDVLPREYQHRASQFIQGIAPLLTGWLLIIHTVFLASLFLGILRRHWPTLIITMAILLKVIIHAILVVQPRYFVPIIALELLVIALAMNEVVAYKQFIKGIFVLAAAVILLLLLIGVSIKSRDFILTHDDRFQQIYRFSLAEPTGRGSLQCKVDHGRLIGLTKQSATLELLNRDPSYGETAHAKCRLLGSGPPTPLYLWIMDPYAPGGLPDRIIQRVVIDAKEVLRHDISAQPGSGWMEIPLGLVGQGTDRPLLIEIIAVRPDPGCAWGAAAQTMFQLSVNRPN